MTGAVNPGALRSQEQWPRANHWEDWATGCSIGIRDVISLLLAAARDYVYDVSVTKDETIRLSHRYRAHLSNAEHIEDGQLACVQVDVQDTYGPTVTEAMRALDASFQTWRQAQLHTRQ